LLLSYEERSETSSLEETQTARSQVVKKEMNLFDTTKKRPENLDKLYHALLTIKPTSVEPERAFSAMELFTTKIRN